MQMLYYKIILLMIVIIVYADMGVCGNTVPSLKSDCSANALCKVSSNGRELINCSCKEGYLGTGPICHSKLECYSHSLTVMII